MVFVSPILLLSLGWQNQRTVLFFFRSHPQAGLYFLKKAIYTIDDKVKQSRYRPRVAQMVPGS